MDEREVEVGTKDKEKAVHLIFLLQLKSKMKIHCKRR